MGDRPLPLLLGEERELENGVRRFREAPRTAQPRMTKSRSLTAAPGLLILLSHSEHRLIHFAVCPDFLGLRRVLRLRESLRYV
jgi:hypothetical protein